MAGEQDTDVQPDPSPGQDTPPTDAAAAQAAVTPPVAGEVDEQGVPWKNRMAEMERRAQKMVEDALVRQAAMYQHVLAQGQQQRANPVDQQKQYTDEELLALANQGHSAALDMLMDRKMARQQQQMGQQQAQQQVVVEAQRELAELYQQYPQMQDASTELYRTANALYQQRAQLYGPNILTQRDAIKSAIIKLGVQPSRASAAESARQGAVESSQSIGGSSYQSRPTRTKEEPFVKVTPQDRELAKKMGLKDLSDKALAERKARFIKRQQDGSSKINHNISSALGGEF
jgi:hypothetical protein